MKLRFYETFYLLHPDLSDEERAEVSQKFQDIITKAGGQIVNVDPWPLRKLAYRVQKQARGYYVLMEYGAPGDVIQELTRNLRLDERVMKFITVKKDDEFDPQAIKADTQKPEEGALPLGESGHEDKTETSEQIAQ